MKKYIFAIILFLNIFSSQINAQGLLGFKEANGCPQDRFLPTLLVCGRNPQTGACAAYTKPCTMGAMVETGKRVIIWIISIILLLTPLYFSYLGAQLMFYQSWGATGVVLVELKNKMFWLLIYFILLLAAWLIVKLIVDVFQVNNRINTFLIDKNGQPVKAQKVDLR